MNTISAVFQYRLILAMVVMVRCNWLGLATVTCIVEVPNKMFVIQVELEDQPPTVDEVDEEVQDAVNVGYQEGLLPEEETVEEQLRLRDSVMSAFNTIFMGYKQINQGFMELSKLIDGTPLHAMGAILNDIQDLAA